MSECKNYNFLPLRLFVKYPKMDAYAYRIAAAGGHTVFIIQTFTFTAFNVCLRFWSEAFCTSF